METIQNFNAILHSFKIKADCVNSRQVDNYYYYDVKLSPAAKVKDLQRYSDEISLALRSPCKPGVRVLHSEGVVRLEFVSPREKPLQYFEFITETDIPSGDLVCLLGQTVDGQRMWMDLAQNPHMIVAGTTGSGKSTLLHNIIANVLNYNDADIHLVDPKQIEFVEYKDKIDNVTTRHTYDDTLKLINGLLSTMEMRYNFLSSKTTTIAELKPIVVIIDEFADLIAQDKDNMFYTTLCRLAQKCRAAKIHLILSTQRPSVNIINGAIKANFPARIACRVASHVDSKVVLDASGAENLLGKGDALLRDNLRLMERFQVAYTTASEVVKYFGV